MGGDGGWFPRTSHSVCNQGASARPQSLGPILRRAKQQKELPQKNTQNTKPELELNRSKRRERSRRMNEDYGIREARRSLNARTVLPDWQQVAEMCGREARIFRLVSRYFTPFLSHRGLVSRRLRQIRGKISHEEPEYELARSRSFRTGNRREDEEREIRIVSRRGREGREESGRAKASGGLSPVYRGGNSASTEVNRRKPRYTELTGLVNFLGSERAYDFGNQNEEWGRNRHWIEKKIRNWKLCHLTPALSPTKRCGAPSGVAMGETVSALVVGSCKGNW